MKLPKKIGRTAACILLVAVFFVLYEGRLFQWQVLEGETYAEEALNDLTDTVEMEAARGEILDRDGEVLAGNRTAYNIVCNAVNMVLPERNATIIKVLNLLRERGEDWEDPLPIVLDAEGEYQFAPDREDEIAALKSQDMLNLADYATADDCMRELAERFNCGGYSKEDSRDVASVRYGMYRGAFSRTNPYVLARGVSIETVGIVNQRAAEWPGVETRVAAVRYYGEDGSLAPHVVGYTGAIRDYQLEAAEENNSLYDPRDNLSGYKRNDTAGISGLEAAFEEELRGKRGQETLYNDDNGDVKDTAVTVQPEEGRTIYTTLDADLQRVANLSLKKNIEGNTKAKDCIAGAAVALDVKDFGVLACASYPTYDMNLYTSDAGYNVSLNNDQASKPLFPRALQGVYTPGSVFKPMVALAALQEGVIGASTTYFCDRLYTLGDDEATALHLKCTDYHGDVNVYGAIAGSCNEFFCNVGVNLTIRKMDAYAECFGLGEKTGVELAESSGTMSNPQEYEINHGTPWLDGASAQTAIGQADNLFTPIQLATYCATMANGGVRLQTHFLGKITDYAREDVLEEYEPRQVGDAGLSSDVLNVVRQGMMSVATTGTARTVFSDYPVSVACKTGTAETSQDGSTEPNISFICYAPAEDPQIAVAVMMEHGKEGDYAKQVAKDLLDQYFGFYTWDADGNRYNQNGDLVDDKDQVLKTKAELDEEKARQERLEQQQFLSSATEGGDASPSPSAAPPASPSPAPNASPSPARDDIPNTPYTGETSSSSSPPPESGEGSPPPPVDGGEDSPYYTGSSSSGSG